MEGPEAIAYAEAVRAISEQRAALDSLRGRAVGLVSLAAVTTALFLGLVPKGSLHVVGWGSAAFLGFLGVAISSGLIIWPWKCWHWNPPAADLVENYIEDENRVSEEKMARDLALILGENHERNALYLNRLYVILALGIGLLGAEILLLFAVV